MTQPSPTPLTPLVQNLMTACFRITSDNGQDPAEKARKELVDAIAALERSLAAAEARNAALVRALKAAPCGQDGFDNPTWDCGEVHCLRCAALTEQRGGKS